MVFVVYLMLSRYGSIRLGPNDSVPEYSNLSWFAMLFTAGMGIGLVYYAVSEPVYHFLNPPTGERGHGRGRGQRDELHLLPLGSAPLGDLHRARVSLGYFSFRRGLPLRPASAFYSLLGDRIYGWPGRARRHPRRLRHALRARDLARASAASRSAPASTSSSGSRTPPRSRSLIIAAITSVAVVSVMLGVDKGIRNLSLANLWLAFALLLFVFVFGPTRDLINTLAANVGTYVQTLPSLGLETFPNGGEQAQGWQNGWTLFYWGWWISWAPFVGMFLARISYGRTIRSFVAGALFAPVGASMVWLTVFGDSALQILLDDPDNALNRPATATPQPVPALRPAARRRRSSPPWPRCWWSSWWCCSSPRPRTPGRWWSTSSPTAGTRTRCGSSGCSGRSPRGAWRPCCWSPGRRRRGADPLAALQAASIAAGLPFCVVLVFMAFGLMKALREEQHRDGPASPSRRRWSACASTPCAPARRATGDAQAEGGAGSAKEDPADA